MSKRAHVPTRMCIGCRRKRRKDEMLQFVKRADEIVFVKERKEIQGKSFYLCPDLLCFEKAKKKERGVGSLESMDALMEGLKQRRKGNGED